MLTLRRISIVCKCSTSAKVARFACVSASAKADIDCCYLVWVMLTVV